MLAIAMNTFKEKIRSKTLYITGITGFILMLLTTTGDGLSINGQRILLFEDRVPVAMSIMQFLGSLLTIMISLQTIPNEFERKTTHLILSRGVKRWQYMFSLTAGNIFTSVVFTLSLYSSLIVFCLILGRSHLLMRTLASILVLSVNIMLLSSIVSVLSIRVPGFINGIVGLALYFLGVFHNLLKTVSNALEGIQRIVMKLGLWLIPNFSEVQRQASNILLNRAVEITPLVVQLLFLYIVLGLTFLPVRKEV
jgi:ABC-type transport system involved in multi-copper enzyme maturation permease subunit